MTDVPTLRRAVDHELECAAFELAIGYPLAAGPYLQRAAGYARRVIATVPEYSPEHYPTIGWYYETRDRIVELMQARVVAP